MVSIFSYRFRRCLPLFLGAFLFGTSLAHAQLDETCTVTVNGRTVDVGFGGEFEIRNIPSGPDLFRVYAVCMENGQTRYGRSVNFIQIFTNQTVGLTELQMQFQGEPFPTVASLRAVPDDPVLGLVRQSTQIQVTATLSDSTEKEVSTREFWYNLSYKQSQCCHRR